MGISGEEEEEVRRIAEPGLYQSMDEAAIDWAEENMPTSVEDNYEYSAAIYYVEIRLSNGSVIRAYGHSNSLTYEEKGIAPGFGPTIPKGAKQVALIHTHSRYDDYNEYFSGDKDEYGNPMNGGDYVWSRETNMPIYMVCQGIIDFENIETVKVAGETINGFTILDTNSNVASIQVLNANDSSSYINGYFSGKAYIGTPVGYISWD